MDKIIELLKMMEKKETHALALIKQHHCQHTPGRLKLKKSSSGTYIYYQGIKNENGKICYHYLKRNQFEIARQLAQQDYDKKVEDMLKHRLPAIQRCIRTLIEHNPDRYYQNLHIARQQLIQPISPTPEQRLAQWRNRPYRQKNFGPNDPEIYTSRGERVRSKIEKIIADCLARMGIDYKYECPLYFRDGMVFHPDFTLFDSQTGKEIYWEHFGMMDDPQYANNAVRKINRYLDEGVSPADRLILTFESSTQILTDRRIEALVQQYLN